MSENNSNGTSSQSNLNSRPNETFEEFCLRLPNRVEEIPLPKQELSEEEEIKIIEKGIINAEKTTFFYQHLVNTIKHLMDNKGNLTQEQLFSMISQIASSRRFVFLIYDSNGNPSLYFGDEPDIPFANRSQDQP